jgi:hypothetical protein
MNDQSKIQNPKSKMEMVQNLKSKIPRRPLALVILDGWGYSPHREGNAIALAHTPYYDEISTKYPKTLLEASGARVGLKEGAPGNSEVGHLNIGAGRVVQAETARIDQSIRNGKFFENQVLLRAIERTKAAKPPARRFISSVWCRTAACIPRPSIFSRSCEWRKKRGSKKFSSTRFWMGATYSPRRRTFTPRRWK